MATREDGAVLRQLNTLFNIGAIRELTDGQLLERFATGRGEAAELAFAALVERHGAMVLRVCRARLADPHDAQDAFQATFLILVKKARALWVRDSLGPWLHQVAFRTASCARSAADRRRRLERGAAEFAASRDGREGRTGSEWEHLLHEEIDRLPECYRVPIVLCDLQGHTCEEAARRMGRPVGTVKSWRSRGRERLRDRLIRLGLAPSAGLGTAFSADAARAAMSKPKAEETARAAVRALSDWTMAGEVSASVRSLVKGVLKAMFLSKLRTTAATIFALTSLAAGLGGVARVAAEDEKRTLDEVQDDASRPAIDLQLRQVPVARGGLGGERWYLSLRDAIRIGLDNSEVVRSISSGARGNSVGGFKPTTISNGSDDRATDDICVIAPVKADADTQRFKAEVMAMVRSVEQQYWALSQQQVQLWSRETAVALGEEILRRELAELEVGRGTTADVAEARQRLENFRLQLVTATSDVITTERGLRRILGLPLADDRQIVPVTAPTEAEPTLEWDDCLAEMLEKQPDIARQKASANVAHRRSEDPDIQQVIHVTTHSLARFFLELKANHDHLQAALKSRASTEERLAAGQADYEVDRIPIDRYLETVRTWADAVAQEARTKADYNTSIAALEEAKGTLLEREKIIVAERPKAATSAVARRDGAAERASHEPPTSVQAPSPIQPEARLKADAPRAKDGEAEDAGPKGDLAGKTFSFQMTVGIGPKPVEIRGSFTVTPVRSVDAPKAR